MNTDMNDLPIALIFILVTAILVVWFRGKLAAGSRSRLYRMMARLGVDPNRFSHSDEDVVSGMKAIRSRCRMCPAEDVCERWLDGEIEGDHGFCPNAKLFDGVVRTG